ncbi:MAG: hypothetical protein RL456_1059 [Pseudomonadota bacterium]|jgi:ComF family protein
MSAPTPLLRRTLARLIEGAGRLAGSRCLVCARWQADPLCPACRAVHADAHAGSARCRVCARRLGARGLDPVCADCARHPPAFDRACAALDYGPPWDRLIAGFKFAGRCELAGPLAALMIGRGPPPGCDGWGDAVLLPVPLAPGRLRERGYNQAWELARRLAGGSGLQARADWLARVVETPHQTGRSRAQRLAGLHGAFVPTPAGLRALPGRAVVLVDDVMTTGATLGELARTVRRAGAASVGCWVLARTMGDDAR